MALAARTGRGTARPRSRSSGSFRSARGVVGAPMLASRFSVAVAVWAVWAVWAVGGAAAPAGACAWAQAVIRHKGAAAQRRVTAEK